MTRGLDVAEWMMATLPSPSDTSRDLVLTGPQIDFLIAFYATDPAAHYVYRRAALQGAKGIGKSPLAAMLALAEFVGPFAPTDPLSRSPRCRRSKPIRRSTRWCSG